MGKYATTSSLQTVLPFFLKGNTTTSDTEGVTIFSKMIDKAEAKIEGMVGSRYDISAFTTTSLPPILRDIAEDIAVYNAIRATGYRSDNRSEYMDDYKSAIDLLGKIASGEVSLRYTDGSILPPVSANRFLSDKTGYTPIFGLDDEMRWQRDDDEIKDQTDARE